MLYLVLAASVLTVGAKELAFLTSNNSMSLEDVTITYPQNDPWSPVIGDTEGAQPVTERSFRAASGGDLSGRRAHSLVESLRRQLMRDNYDYLDKDSEDYMSNVTEQASSTSSPSTAASATSTTSAADISHAPQTQLEITPYHNPMSSTQNVEAFPVARAQAKVQVASVNLPSFPASAGSSAGTPHPAAPHPPADGDMHRLRSFDEAYNTPSPSLDQFGRAREPKQEVFKKDLLYYVDDDRLNNGLHLRRNNDLSSDAALAPEQEQNNDNSKYENLSAQELLDTIRPQNNIQQRRQRQRDNSVYHRQRKTGRHGHKRRIRHRDLKKQRVVEGVNRRSKLYGLQVKNPRKFQEIIKRRQNRAQQDSEQNERVANAHDSQYDDVPNEPQKDDLNYRRSDQFDGRQYAQREGKLDSRRSNISHDQELVEQKGISDGKINDPTDNQYDAQYDDQNTTKYLEDNVKKSANETDGLNKRSEIKSLLQQPLQSPDSKQNINVDNVDDDLEQGEQRTDLQQYDNNGRRSFAENDNQYGEETTSNVKYKLLKVRSLGGSRRSGVGGPRHILQERGSQGVALISLDQAPFPQFRLPRARRQYMQETSDIRHPLLEQLPRAPPVSRKTYVARRRQSH